MFTQIQKQANMQGIAASAVATTKIPSAGTLYALYFRCLAADGVTSLTVAQIKAAIGNIIIRIDGEQIMEATATFFLALQKYYGDSIVAGNVNGVLPIYFAQPTFATFPERSLFAIGMKNIGAFTVDMNILSTAVLSSIQVFAEVTAESRNVGQHVRIYKHPQTFATTGDQEINSLPKSEITAAYKALHIETGSDTGGIDRVTVKVGGNAVFDQVDSVLNGVLLSRDMRTTQSGFYHVDFCRSRDLTGMIPMAGLQDWRQIITWNSAAAPSNYNIYSEQIWGLNVAASK